MEDAKLKRKIEKLIKGTGVDVFVDGGIAHLSGELDSWDEVVELGHKVGKLKVEEVVNDVTAKEVKVKARREEGLKLSKKIYNPTLPKSAEVVIIGGGVIGCFIARELSRYDLDIALLEKECDIGEGATKSNSAQIHTGMGEHSGTLKKELCAKSWPLYEKISEELDVPYKKNGLLVVLTRDTLPKVPSFIGDLITKTIIARVIKGKAKKVGDEPRIVKKEELMEMEPNLTDRALVAVLNPNYGTICPHRLTTALAENAFLNGVNIFLDTEVVGISPSGEGAKVTTTRGEIEARFIVNAAGVYADRIAEMAGSKEFTIHPRKGSTLLFDKEVGDYVDHQISEIRLPQDPYTKGGAVLKTVDENINWGPTAVETADREDTSVTADEIQSIFKKYGSIIPDFSTNSLITYFSGVRASTYKEDFYIKPSKKVKGLVNVAGIQSPGLTAAPFIAKMVVDILKKLGLEMVEKEDFNPYLKRPIVFEDLNLEEKEKLVAGKPSYGNVICRCEHVTEGEILDAIRSPIPALTLDGIKRRTRAGMGRCQGGFCGPRVAEIIAREFNIPLEEVTKDGGGSELFVGKTKMGEA
jgi:glycerol-3-phosphate dehydrogenase